jgi:hypothetical protein
MSNNQFTDTILLDVAFMSQEFTQIHIAGIDNHIIELDEIPVTTILFKLLFYPHGENFELNNQLAALTNNNQNIISYISFLPCYRTINCEPFSLLEQVIAYIEKDLCVSRNCFTTNTLIELSKELSEIKTLNNICWSSIAHTLSWSDIINIIKNEKDSRAIANPLRHALLVISVVFKNPNPNILPIIIKFRYKIENIVDYLS